MRTAVPPVACVGEPRLTAGFAEYGRLDLLAHEEVHGPIGPMEPAQLLRLAEGIAAQGQGRRGVPVRPQAARGAGVLRAAGPRRRRGGQRHRGGAGQLEGQGRC